MLKLALLEAMILNKHPQPSPKNNEHMQGAKKGNNTACHSGKL